jgi:hypothetical protein
MAAVSLSKVESQGGFLGQVYVGGCEGTQTTKIIDLAGALVGSNPGPDLNHSVLWFRHSFQSLGKCLRRHATTFTDRLGQSDG